MPHDALQRQSSCTQTQDRQRPGVRSLLGARPEAVLGLLVLGKLLGLGRVGLGVPRLLVLLQLRIASNVAQEGVVGNRSQQHKWVELARSPEEQREREVNQSITKIATELESVTLSLSTRRRDSEGYSLGVADNAPDTSAVQRVRVLLVVLGELVVGKDFEGETGAKDKDGKIVDPFNRPGQGRASTSKTNMPLVRVRK